MDDERLRRWELLKLKHELLLRKVREWRLDNALSGSPDQEEDALEGQIVSVAGKAAAVAEEISSVEDKLGKLRAGTEEGRRRVKELAGWVHTVLQPIFEWDSRITVRHRRVSHSDPVVLVEELLNDGTTRESWSRNVSDKVGQAQRTSLELLNRLRASHKRTRGEVRAIRRDTDAQLHQTRAALEEEAVELGIDFDNLCIINREQRFHLKRGSNYKDSHGERGKEGGHNEGVSPHAVQKLTHRKEEEVAHAERILTAERAALEQVGALVKQRREERDALVAARDALLRDIEAQRTTLRDSSHPVFASRSSPSPPLSSRKLRDSSPATHHRTQSPSALYTFRGIGAASPIPHRRGGSCRRSSPSPVRISPVAYAPVPIARTLGKKERRPVAAVPE